MKVSLSQMSLRACETLKPFALPLSISPVLFPNAPCARSDNCDNRPPCGGRWLRCASWRRWCCRRARRSGGTQFVPPFRTASGVSRPTECPVTLYLRYRRLRQSLVDLGVEMGVGHADITKLSLKSTGCLEILAEGMGFEPTVRLDSVQRFSKPPPSATRPPLLQGVVGDFSHTTFACLILGPGR